jgi:hypothetical protein
MDGNITTRSGASFLAKVREAVKLFSHLAEIPENPCNKVQHQFLLEQWLEIEEMLGSTTVRHE